jgi:ribosomal protein S4E
MRVMRQLVGSSRSGWQSDRGEAVGCVAVVVGYYRRGDAQHSTEHILMATTKAKTVVDGVWCEVIGGTHKGKAGTIRDIKTSATGAVTITVVMANGDRFKTLAKNVKV